MRLRALVAVAALLGLALPGCLGQFEAPDRSDPEEVRSDVKDDPGSGTAGYGTTGCVDDDSVGTGTGDIGSDRACPAENATTSTGT